jgi:hypothetical protein
MKPNITFLIGIAIVTLQRKAFVSGVWRERDREREREA